MAGPGQRLGMAADRRVRQTHPLKLRGRSPCLPEPWTLRARRGRDAHFLRETTARAGRRKARGEGGGEEPPPRQTFFAGNNRWLP